MKNVYDLIGIELLSMKLNLPMVTTLHVLHEGLVDKANYHHEK